MDYARTKPEGMAAAKYSGPHDSFYCWDCKVQWESNPKDWELYYEYKVAVEKTTLVAHNMSPDGGYQVQTLGDMPDFEKRERLAEELVSSYRHLLNLDAGEWFEIEQDTKNL